MTRQTMPTNAATSQEGFAEHSRALRAQHLEDVVNTFHDDAIVIANKEVYRGLDGARQAFSRLLPEVPQAQWEVDRVWADDVLYIEWKARSVAGHVDDGIDTIIFRDGKIQMQTIHYTLQRGPGQGRTR